MHFIDLAQAIAAEGAVTADAVLALRQAGWADGRITPDEAEAIFAANHALGAAAAPPDAAWSDFFVEALAEYVVNRWEPKGYVTADQAAWLCAHVDRDGRVDSVTELELLVRVFEKAVDVPPALRAHALGQVERAVLTGEGPTRCGGRLEPGRLTAAEAAIVRRVIFSTGSERPGGVSRAEAEMLFRIKDAVVEAENAPEWRQLFIQGVGHYLSGFTAHRPMSRARAAELEAFMADDSASIGRFLRRMATDRPDANRFGLVFGRKRPPSRDFAGEAAADAVITHDEQDWLDSQIEANGRLDDYDRALLDFLAAPAAWPL